MSVPELPLEYSRHGQEEMEISTPCEPQASLHQNRIACHGPVAILWDIENCPVPSDVRAEDVAGNIRMALRVHPVIDGAVKMFSAYGDFNAFPRRLREGCQRTGVRLIDVPNGRKDAADKAILVDMFLFALDNRPPSSVVLISGDVDFAPAVHILGQRGYTIILVIPSSVSVSSALSSAGRFVWDWPSVARGEGFVPPARTLIPPRAGPADTARHMMGCPINDNMDNQNNEESIVYKGISKGYYNTRDCLVASQAPPEPRNGSILVPQNPMSLRSSSPPSTLKEVTSRTLISDNQNGSTSVVQPGDINGLKVQLANLLELLGGSLPLTRLPAEYHKHYGWPLYVSNYGASKLVKLLKKMSDAISVEGKGPKKLICLRDRKPGPINAPVILARRDKKEKRSQEDGIDMTGGAGSSDEFSEDERVIVGGSNNDKAVEKSNSEVVHCPPTIRQNLNKFKYELQEILVSYSCRVYLGCFEVIYQQRYGAPLDYGTFGVNCIEELLEKVTDVVVVVEEPTSKLKFLVALAG